MRGKVAVVTAASGGLGRAIAEEFAAEGATTIIAARNEARLAATVLFMAGTHGRQPRTYSVTAGITNAALINASKVMAEAAAPFNIRGNAINPGPIDSDRMAYLATEKAAEVGIPVAEAQRILADVTPAQAFRRAARACLARRRWRPGPGDLAHLAARVLRTIQ